MATFGLLPMPSAHRHGARRMVRRPRHRYQTPMMIHPAFDRRTHRAHRTHARSKEPNETISSHRLFFQL